MSNFFEENLYESNEFTMLASLLSLQIYMQRYFDAAASTPLDPLVKDEMQRYFDIFGNKNSKHFRGFEAMKLVEKSMQKMADVLGTSPSHLTVAYSGTDANRKFIWACRKRFGVENLYASAVEHSSITDEVLPENKFDPLGDFTNIAPTAKMISLMAANSETGTLFPAAELRERFPNALIQRDYIQAIGKKPIEFEHADAISFAPHKFYGPKMTGLIWLKNPQSFPEISKDSHTKNAWLIAGMAKAFELLGDGKVLSGEGFVLPTKMKQLQTWQEQIENFVTENVPESKIRHQDLDRIAGTMNISFRGVRGGELAQVLSQDEQICVSTGSACTSDILQPTDTIKFFESDPDWQFPIRVSLHKFLTDESVNDFCEILAYYVEALRKR